MKAKVNRRTAMYASVVAGVGLVGLGAGAAVAWLQRHSVEAIDAENMKNFWMTEFESLSGPRVKMADFQGRPLVLNFWATWCAPCVEEMPLIDFFYRQNKANGWQVVGIAVDEPSRVREFLRRSPVSYPIALNGMDVARFGKMLGNESASLPFTVIFDAKGKLIYRKLGKLSTFEIEKWRGHHLDRSLI